MFCWRLWILLYLKPTHCSHDASLWFCYVLRSCCLPESQDAVAHIQIVMFCKWKKSEKTTVFHQTPAYFQALHNLFNIKCPFIVCTLCFCSSLSYFRREIGLTNAVMRKQNRSEQNSSYYYYYLQGDSAIAALFIRCLHS